MLIEYQVQYFKGNNLVGCDYFFDLPTKAEITEDNKFEYDRFEVWKITKEHIDRGTIL
jgi:hypothetical protein